VHAPLGGSLFKVEEEVDSVPSKMIDKGKEVAGKVFDKANPLLLVLI